ncbi:GIN domain-containing protein [Spirosoma sordidisoli]|nr:DUF2807 domain-containing protein [Spirosoma sordidisoli]
MSLLIGSMVNLAIAQKDSSRVFLADQIDKLVFLGSFEIKISPGETFKVEAVGQQADIQQLAFQLRRAEKTLAISCVSGNSCNVIKLYVTMPELVYIDMHGSSNCKIDKFSTLKTMSMDIHGAAKLEMKMSGPKLKVNSFGSSQVILSGEVKDVDLHSSDVSQVHAYELKSMNARVLASTGANVNLYVENNLNIESYGNSIIRYKGLPVVNHTSTGRAILQHIN